MSNALETLSNSFADAVKIGSQNLVRVDARRRLPASGILWEKKGMVITANHVLQRDEGIIVGLPSGETSEAELIGRDQSLDMALLRIGVDRKGQEWKSSAQIKVGHLVLALGRPGSDAMATHGIVSALGGAWRIPHYGRKEPLIQTDVVMYPGFSGGPLVDSQGAVLGLNSSGLVRGISIAIPRELVESRVEALLEHGYIRRGYLGVSIQPVRIPSALRGELNQETGLLIASVEEGSPAETAGVLQGDVLVAVEGEPLRYPDDLLHQLGLERVGQELSLQIIRGGKPEMVKLIVGEQG